MAADVGERKGEFLYEASAANDRKTYPSYTHLDLNASLTIGEGWNLNLFVQNATNKRGLTGGGFYNQTSFNDFWFNYIR